MACDSIALDCWYILLLQISYLDGTCYVILLVCLFCVVFFLSTSLYLGVQLQTRHFNTSSSSVIPKYCHWLLWWKNSMQVCHIDRYTFGQNCPTGLFAHTCTPVKWNWNSWVLRIWGFHRFWWDVTKPNPRLRTTAIPVGRQPVSPRILLIQLDSYGHPLMTMFAYTESKDNRMRGKAFCSTWSPGLISWMQFMSWEVDFLIKLPFCLGSCEAESIVCKVWVIAASWVL